MAELPTLITVTMNTAIDRVLRVPGFAVGGHLEAEVVSRSPAGKGVNLTRALAGLGRSSTATGFVGEAEAEAFRSCLQSGDGPGRIDHQLIPVPGQTRENITVVDPNAKTDTHLRTRGYAVTHDDVSTLASKISKLSQNNAVVVFTGSLPPGLDDNTLLELITAAQQNGARVVLDLNGNTLGAVLANINQPVWMVSPNRAEFTEAMGCDTELDIQSFADTARRVCPAAGWVLLSMGSSGALMVTESAVFKGTCEADQSRVLNTVSAGDCLLAGVLDARLRGLAPQDALRHGLAVATASTFHVSPAVFDQDDVKALIEPTLIDVL